MGKKILIIGGGPGGYVAAIRAAQLGAEVRLVEREKLGGTCLNVGCIPTKALLRIGAFYQKAAAAQVPGVKSRAELDWAAALAHKEAVVGQLTGGVAWLLKKHGVQIHSGVATLLPDLCAQVGDDTFSADAIILATGSAHAALPFPGSGLEGVIDSTEALSLAEPPKSMAIIGGGVIGVEFASLYASLGTAVTLVEMMPEVLPNMDAEIAGLLREKLTKAGIRVYLDTKVEKVEYSDNSLAVSLVAGGLPDAAPGKPTRAQAGAIQVEKVLVAVGRRPNTAGIGLEAAGVAMDRGAVVTDDDCRTNIPGLYAVGDCNGKAMLAHAAMAQGIAAAEHILGIPPYFKRKAIPGCVYTSPEVASAGMTEKQIQDMGIAYSVGRFPLSANGKAVAEGEDGLMKVIADKATGEVLGVHMLGPKATEVIAGPALCMNMEGTVEDIANTVYGHPTVGEALGEAALAVFGKPIHA